MNQVSLAMFVIQGLVGPKLRQKCVSDGQLVNIPALLKNRYQLGREQDCDSIVSTGRDSSSKLVSSGKSGLAFSLTGECTRAVTKSQSPRAEAIMDNNPAGKTSM